MKWKAKERPKNDERRTIKRFALFPIKTTNGYWVWLEYVFIHQIYGSDGSTGVWFNTKVYQKD